MKTICIANAKGGVAKTTTTAALATILTLKGYKVLCLDLDPQRNLSNQTNAPADNRHGIVPVILNEESIFNHIQHTEYYDIVPCDSTLSSAQTLLSGNGGAFILDKAIKRSTMTDKNYTLNDEYDFVIIDTPPTFGPLVINSLVAANYVVVPVLHDGKSLDGFIEIYKNVQIINQYYNRNVKIAGLLRTRWEVNTRVAKVSSEDCLNIAQQKDTIVFKSLIRKAISVSESLLLSQNLVSYDTDSHVVNDYINFTEELLDVINKEEQLEAE